MAEDSGPDEQGDEGRANAAGGATTGSADPLDDAWSRVEQDWDDPQAHDRFVELCLQLGRLPEAGRRYRHVRETDPQRSEDARQRIDRLLTLATRTLELSRTEPPDTGRARRRIFYAALGLSLVMVLSAVWAWVF